MLTLTPSSATSCRLKITMPAGSRSPTTLHDKVVEIERMASFAKTSIDAAKDQASHALTSALAVGTPEALHGAISVAKFAPAPLIVRVWEAHEALDEAAATAKGERRLQKKKRQKQRKVEAKAATAAAADLAAAEAAAAAHEAAAARQAAAARAREEAAARKAAAAREARRVEEEAEAARAAERAAARAAARAEKAAEKAAKRQARVARVAAECEAEEAAAAVRAAKAAREEEAAAERRWLEQELMLETRRGELTPQRGEEGRLGALNTRRRFRAKPDAASECVICLDGPGNHAIIPCGHQCVCAECAATLCSPHSAPAPSGRATCPICSAQIQATLRIFKC